MSIYLPFQDVMISLGLIAADVFQVKTVRLRFTGDDACRTSENMLFRMIHHPPFLLPLAASARLLLRHVP